MPFPSRPLTSSSTTSCYAAQNLMVNHFLFFLFSLQLLATFQIGRQPLLTLESSAAPALPGGAPDVSSAENPHPAASAGLNSTHDSSSKKAGVVHLKVMTFNTWQSGKNVEDGFAKVINHIKIVDPDIVGLQEVQTQAELDDFLEELGEPWTGLWHSSPVYPDTGILSKFKIDKNQVLEVSRGMGASIILSESPPLRLNFFSLHLNVRSFQLYAAQNKLVTTEEQLLKGESSSDGEGRLQNIQELLNDPRFKAISSATQQSPLLVVGDFNTPSHLDWVAETRADHGGWAFEWPVTKVLADEGLIDSFRHLHPNVSEVPGRSWSTVQKASGSEWEYTVPEPQDRIDFIFYKGASLSPTASYLYPEEPEEGLEDEEEQEESLSLRDEKQQQQLLLNGTSQNDEKAKRKKKSLFSPIPNHLHNDYPSDHYALITEFELVQQQQQ